MWRSWTQEKGGGGEGCGKLQVTDAAGEVGRSATDNGFSKVRRRRFKADHTPWVTFASPGVGRVGMTEAEAAEVGGRVAYLPLTEVDRAMSNLGALVNLDVSGNDPSLLAQQANRFGAGAFLALTNRGDPGGRCAYFSNRTVPSEGGPCVA